MERILERNVMKMAKTSKPELVQLFENLLWANSPQNWIIKSTYFQKTLFISILIKTSQKRQSQKIHRSFGMDIIYSRAEDLYGLATDCIDEIKTEIKNYGDII